MYAIDLAINPFTGEYSSVAAWDVLDFDPIRDAVIDPDDYLDLDDVRAEALNSGFLDDDSALESAIATAAANDEEKAREEAFRSLFIDEYAAPQPTGADDDEDAARLAERLAELAEVDDTTVFGAELPVYQLVGTPGVF